MSNPNNLTDKQMKECRHERIVINPQIVKTYCKKCHKNLINDMDFINKKIKDDEFETSYEYDIALW
jgi:RNase P subunit RPR2